MEITEDLENVNFNLKYWTKSQVILYLDATSPTYDKP